jgi:hypothetical protein
VVDAATTPWDAWIDADGDITDEYTYPGEALDEAVARWSTATFPMRLSPSSRVAR